MPKLSPEVYDAQNQTVLNLAARPGIGVSRNEIMAAIPCSRPRAEKLVKALGLILLREDGRTDFFGPPVSVPASSEVASDNVIDVLPTEPTTNIVDSTVTAPVAQNTATATATAPVATARKSAVKSVSPEITLLENRARKLAGELELVRTKLIAALMTQRS